MKHFSKTVAKRSTAALHLMLAMAITVAFVVMAIPAGEIAAEESAAGKTLQSAPLNPAFVEYCENPSEPLYGYIPPPMDLSHLDSIPVKQLQAQGPLPSSFDWRDYGKMTPVKDQSACATCWIFGTTSVLESAVLIGESAEYDFSEQSVALCVDRSWIYLYDGADDPCMAEGNSFKASEVFIKKGSVLESCNPYNTTALNCDGFCVCDDCTPVKKVDGYRLATNDGSQIDVIKDAVCNHGPVSMGFFSDPNGSYIVEPWGTIYDHYPSPGPDHMVSIIGWNDSVPHPNPAHDGTGAWIVKNSWGTGWGNDGYFYLAYNSSCVEEIAYLEYKDPVPGDELLYWDEAGLVNSIGSGYNTAWMASVFTAPNSGDLTHVDFWTTSSNAQYEIYVWASFFGTELAHQTGNCQEYGYYSIPLTTTISVDAGQQFTVGVKMTTPGYNYPIPVEREITGRVDPPIQSNVSFARHNASDSWTDLADGGSNACLRARLRATQAICTLTMAVSGNGSTTPAVGPNDYTCGTDVPISATPDAGWVFVNWTGGVADPTSHSTTVLVDTDKIVTAHFGPLSGKTICSFLGDHAFAGFSSVRDCDAYTFDGEEGEEVIIKLEADPLGAYTGEYALSAYESPVDVSLFKKIRKFQLSETQRGALPLEMTLALPTTGQYRIKVGQSSFVREGGRFYFGDQFEGNYCLTLESSGDAWQTLDPTSSSGPTTVE